MNPEQAVVPPCVRDVWVKLDFLCPKTHLPQVPSQFQSFVRFAAILWTLG